MLCDVELKLLGPDQEYVYGEVPFQGLAVKLIVFPCVTVPEPLIETDTAGVLADTATSVVAVPETLSESVAVTLKYLVVADAGLFCIDVDLVASGCALSGDNPESCGETSVVYVLSSNS